MEEILALDSPRWATLRHTYEEALDIPERLRELEEVAEGRRIPAPPWYEFQTEPWFSLWSALCHQGDVYSASFAAVPHILRIAARAQRDVWEYFAFVSDVGICRATAGTQIPDDLGDASRYALNQISNLVYQLSDREWDELLTRSVTAALAVCKGQVRLGKAIL